MRVSLNGGWSVRLAYFLVLAFLAPAVAAVAQGNDVRILIDVSGSMRQNDPQNLRRPALRMLTGLLQSGTRAGVWSFAHQVNNLVPVAEVDDGWKKRTRAVSQRISSPGQFTDIEAVLDRASSDWQGEPGTHARHLLLLTDGMVDVSKDAAANDASRQRILEQLLPRLQATGVQVHTIALSARADHDLMQRLAGATGGWYQQVDRADELQRVFLRMFEKVGKPDAVPLQDNRFVVDGSVTEATVLLFSKPGSPPVVLRSPSGEEFSDSDLPSGVAWSRDQGYDMITIASPEKGEWALQADLDPDNRVMIVTDLKLQTSDVPSHLAVDEVVRIEAGLSNRGKPVTRQAFLRLLDVQAEAVGPAGARPQALNDSGEGADAEAGDGRYTMDYGEAGPQQEVELLIAVDSPTFMREKRFRLVVHEPLVASVADTAQGPQLVVEAQTAVLHEDARVSAWQQRADGQRVELPLALSGPGQWTAALADPEAASFVQVSGTSRLGNPIERTLGPILPAGVVLPPVAVPPPAEAAAQAAVQPAPAEAAAEEGGWLLPALLFGGFNLLLVAGGLVWFVLARRRRAEPDEAALDELIELQVEPTAAAASDGRQEDAA